MQKACGVDHPVFHELELNSYRASSDRFAAVATLGASCTGAFSAGGSRPTGMLNANLGSLSKDGLFSFRHLDWCLGCRALGRVTFGIGAVKRCIERLQKLSAAPLRAAQKVKPMKRLTLSKGVRDPYAQTQLAFTNSFLASAAFGPPSGRDFNVVGHRLNLSQEAELCIRCQQTARP